MIQITPSRTETLKKGGKRITYDNKLNCGQGEDDWSSFKEAMYKPERKQSITRYNVLRQTTSTFLNFFKDYRDIP